MDQWQRCAAGRTRRLSLHPIWGTIGVIPVLYFGILSFVFLIAGVWLRVSTPDAVPNPDFLQILVADVQGWASSSIGPIVGLVFCAFTLWGLVCAAMSTIDSYIMTASQTFFVDIFNYDHGTLVELDKEDYEKKLLLKARAFTIFIPVLVIALAYIFSFASDVYALIYFAFSFMFALLPPLFVGLMGWAKPIARRACEYGLLAGGISSVIGYVIILTYLERALRENDLSGIFGWYQAVYWWPTVVTLVGALVMWLSWPRKQRTET